jgi:hypothetical protein
MGFSSQVLLRRFAIKFHGETADKLASPEKQISFRFLAPGWPTSENEALRDQARSLLKSSRVLNRRLRR